MEFSDILKVLLASILPLSELRGAIPLAVLEYDFAWYYAFIIAVIGNLIPVPFILLLLDKIVPLLLKLPGLGRIVSWYLDRVEKRSRVVERYENIGLALIVAIPLPFTGAWTGSILAVLMGLRFKFAFLSIMAGVLVAGVIVTLATMLGWAVFSAAPVN